MRINVLQINKSIKKLAKRIIKKEIGRPVGAISVGVEVKNCRECRQNGWYETGCYFCEDAGVDHIKPIGKVDGFGVLVPRFCFNCGRPLFFQDEGDA